MEKNKPNHFPSKVWNIIPRLWTSPVFIPQLHFLLHLKLNLLQTATEILYYINSVFKTQPVIPIWQISYNRQNRPLTAVVYIKKGLKRVAGLFTIGMLIAKVKQGEIKMPEVEIVLPSKTFPVPRVKDEEKFYYQEMRLGNSLSWAVPSYIHWLRDEEMQGAEGY